jgi:hypothetical protein
MNFGMYGVMVELGKLRIVDCGGCQTSQDGCQFKAGDTNRKPTEVQKKVALPTECVATLKSKHCKMGIYALKFGA